MSKLWIARNGWYGNGAIGCLVEADTEEEAKERASAALLAEALEDPSHKRDGTAADYATVCEVEELELPWVGEIE